MSRVAIILAAGQGKRMDAGINKQYLHLGNQPILVHTLKVFEACPCIDGIVLVAHPQEVVYVEAEIVAKVGAQKVLVVVAGGAQRQDSVYQGLLALPSDCSQVVVHDGARPLVTSEVICQVFAQIQEDLGIIVGVPVKDTIKRVDDRGMVVETPSRAQLWQVQTPQGFPREMLMASYQAAMNEGYYGTDDASLVEHAGGKVKIIMGCYDNIKITTPEDLVMAEGFETKTKTLLGGSRMRVGFGYDVHGLVAGRALTLGGVEIPYEKGLLGHSDADVLVHALMDALLGAAALGDIGRHFPDTDPAYQGISSMILLDKVMGILTKSGYKVNNVDLTVVAQKPKLAGYIPQMVEKISPVLGLEAGWVNIKATTTEGLGFAGRGEGIACYGVCTIEAQ